MATANKTFSTVNKICLLVDRVFVVAQKISFVVDKIVFEEEIPATAGRRTLADMGTCYSTADAIFLPPKTHSSAQETS